MFKDENSAGPATAQGSRDRAEGRKAVWTGGEPEHTASCRPWQGLYSEWVENCWRE